jgi:hypothetical protein
MPARAAQNRGRIEFRSLPNQRRVVALFGVTFVTREPFLAAIEFDGDDVNFAVVMGASSFRVNARAVHFFAVNQFFRSHIEFTKQFHSSIVKVSARRTGSILQFANN